MEVCCGKGWMCWQDEAGVAVYVRIKSKDSRAFFVFPVSGEGAVIQTNAKCISTCIRAVRPHSAVEFKELAHLTGFSSLQVMLISPYVHICQMHPKLSGILNDFSFVPSRVSSTAHQTTRYCLDGGIKWLFLKN